MNIATRLFALIIPLTVALTTQTDAQGFGTRTTAGVFGGASLPNGVFHDELGRGWHAGALAKMRLVGLLDLRADGSYAKFGAKEIAGSAPTLTTHGKVAFGTLSAVLNLGPDSAAYPGDKTVAPYLIGGFGRYRLDYAPVCSGSCDTIVENNWGVNFGGGATIPLMGIRTFLEARYHRMSRNAEIGGNRTMLFFSGGVKIR